MYGAKIDSSSNNIPTTFDTTAGSLVIDGTPSSRQIEIINRTTEVLAITLVSKKEGVTVPSSVITTNRRQLYVPPAPTSGTAGWVKDYLKINQGDKLYLRSDGSAASSGNVYINLWTALFWVASVGLSFSTAGTQRLKDIPLRPGVQL